MKKRASIYRFSWFNAWFAIKLLIVIGLWGLCYQCFEVVKNIEPLKTFVPNEILGVETDATVAQVKKAYRKLSREKHPDKNPDEDTTEQFMKVKTAYEILNDPEKRVLYDVYGTVDFSGDDKMWSMIQQRFKNQTEQKA